MAVRHRNKLTNKLASTMYKELKCQRSGDSILGDSFEFIKQKARFRFTDDELSELCLCLASVVVNANGTCRIVGKRPQFGSNASANFVQQFKGKNR